jgi:hypothetical protein
VALFSTSAAGGVEGAEGATVLDDEAENEPEIETVMESSFPI